jgi:hypothetical protein
MKVRLKHRAFVSKVGVFEPGIVDWPEGAPLPSSAEKVSAAEAKKAESEEGPQEPVALSEVNPVTGNKK